MLLALIAFSIACSLPASAQALVQEVVKQNASAVAEYTYRSGGSAVPGGTCGSTCTTIWNLQHTTPPGANPTVTETLNRQLVELGRKVKTLPKASLIGKVSLAATSFTVGLWIGDLINDKLLHIGGPAEPAEPNYESFSLVWYWHGENLGDWNLWAPRDGYYLQASPGNVRAFKRWTGTTEGSCSNLDPEPSEYLDLTLAEDACYLGGEKMGMRQLHAYVYDQPFEIPEPIQDFDEDEYDIRIGDWPEEPASMSQLETRVQAAIEEDDLPLTNAFLAHALQPENYPDPRITKTRQDHRCDRTPGPRYANPGGNVSPEPFAKHIATPFTITNRPEGYGSVDVYLHAGTTHWIPGKDPEEPTSYLDDWGGWGYRHIVAKHGWSELDLKETELALASSFPEQVGETAKYVYSLPISSPGAGGVGCVRHVVVKFELEMEDPRPLGIMTSFNEVVSKSP
jgi:nitrogen fixation protein